MPTNAEHCRAYYAKNREKLLADKRRQWSSDPDESRRRSREKYAANREKNVERAREYRLKNREEVNARAMAKYVADRDLINERRKGYRAKHYDKIYARIQEWRKRNPARELLYHAKRLISEQTGIAIRDVPNDVAEAKVEQLLIARWVKEELSTEEQHG